MENSSEIENYVSCETLEKLKIYETLLKKWQKAINLVSKNTISNAWERHFLDSLQLIKYLPKTESKPHIVDLGSGAGFPPLVLAICGYDHITAIESDQRKCLFMQEVAKETNTKIKIITDRIENVEKMEADIITSRALAKIDELLIFSKHLSSKETKYLFLKGKTAKEEVKKAKKDFDFEDLLYPSLTSSEANIVKISNLSEKK